MEKIEGFEGDPGIICDVWSRGTGHGRPATFKKEWGFGVVYKGSATPLPRGAWAACEYDASGRHPRPGSRGIRR
jgi:hypothetical protein